MMAVPKLGTMLYRCFWCDRTTRFANVMIIDRGTGYLKCEDCSRYDERNV